MWQLMFSMPVMRTVNWAQLTPPHSSHIPCVYKQMLRWFPSFQVATTCLSCSPPDLKFLVTCLIFVYM